MTVSIEHKNDVTALITVAVQKADYEAEVEKTLRNYRQRADIPGFRKGNVPMGMIKKKYGVGIKIEEINKAVGKALYDYINENKLAVLGEPMPHENGQKEYDFNKDEDFEFKFDVAIAPKAEISLGKEDKVPYFNIEPTEEMVSSQIESMLNSYGKSEEADTVEENDIVKGILTELENGEIKDGGIQKEDAMLLPKYIKAEEEKALFIGAKKNSVITFNPFVAYDGNEYELSSFLGIDRKQVANYKDKEFTFEITSISRHTPADMDEEFFKLAFGEQSEVRDEAGLRTKITEGFQEQFNNESDYKFLLDLRQIMMEKAGKLEFPDELLKRWLKVSNPERTQEQLDEEYPKMIEDLTYHMLKDKLVEKNNIEVSEEEVKNFAIIVAKSQFAQYGMSSVPDEVLANYAKSLLEKEDSRRNFTNRVVENKLAAVIKGQVTLDEKTVSPDEFSKMIQEQEQA